MQAHKPHDSDSAVSQLFGGSHKASTSAHPLPESTSAPALTDPALHPKAEHTASLFSHFADQTGGAQAPSDAELEKSAAAIKKKVNVADPTGILGHMHPTGAGSHTATQEGLSKGGVNASKIIAEKDWNVVMQNHDLRHKYEVAGKKYGIPPALLAAIASRETHGGTLLDSHGEGDGGHGYGLMQVDVGTAKADRSGGAYGQAHINQATGILKAKIDAVKKQFPHLSPELQLQTAVSRYNGGFGHAAPDSDAGTTYGDYGNDTVARAQYYAGHWNKK